MNIVPFAVPAGPANAAAPQAATAATSRNAGKAVASFGALLAPAPTAADAAGVIARPAPNPALPVAPAAMADHIAAPAPVMPQPEQPALPAIDAELPSVGGGTQLPPEDGADLASGGKHAAPVPAGKSAPSALPAAPVDTAAAPDANAQPMPSIPAGDTAEMPVAHADDALAGLIVEQEAGDGKMADGAADGDADLTATVQIARQLPIADARSAGTTVSLAATQEAIAQPVGDEQPTSVRSTPGVSAAPVNNAAAASQSATVTQQAGAAIQAEVAANGADMPDGLPAPLMSQALPGAVQRAGDVDQLYGGHAANPHQPVVIARPGTIGRDMGVEIARQISAGKEEVLVRLDPAELGRIDVRMSFDRDGNLRATVTAESLVALDMLRRDSGDLTRALADAGVRADSQSFRFDGRGSDGGQFAQRGQQQGDRGGDGQTRGGAGETADENPQYRRLATSGRIDVMA